MQIRELFFFPDGGVFRDRTFDTGELDGEELRDFESRWRSAPSQFELRFTSEILLGGTHPDADAQLCDAFLASMHSVKSVKQLSSKPAPFDAIRAVAERPLIAGVFWPMIPVDELASVEPVVLSMSAAFFNLAGE